MADELWTFSTGKWGYSRVRVYEREPGGALHMEATGRKRESLANLNGDPVFDKDLAVAIAKEVSRQIEAGKEAKQARQILGLPERHTLAQLLAKYHGGTKARKWSAKHKANQERHRDFWLETLGARSYLTDIGPEAVEATANKGARANDWSPETQRKYLSYLRGAFNYARTKLKWITEGDDLRGVDLPEPTGTGEAYTRDEAVKILDAAPTVDLRLAVACELAWATGRRIGAILQARSDGYRVEGGYGVVPFPAESDKARKAGEVYIKGKARERVEMLLQRPLVRSSGWLLPDGDLERGGRAEPMSYDQLLRLFRQAEKAAGVEYVKGRGPHGFKRAFATVHGSSRGASQQAGTSRSTLERKYEKANPTAKKAVADEAEALRDRA